MNNIMCHLQKEIEQLNTIIENTEFSLKKAPAGILKISKSNGSTQYYLRKNSADWNGTYIKKKDRNLARALAQKDYDSQVIVHAQNQRDAITSFISTYHSNDIQKIYTSLSAARQSLVSPCIPTDDAFVKQWEKQKYTAKSFSESAPEIYTEKEERVRSKSEKILADKFYMMEIPYRYEYPLHLKGYGIIYPDFLLLNKRTREEYYWEHFGLMDDPEYCEKALRKIETYENNNIFPGKNLLLTYETSNHTLNMKAVERIIKEFLL